VPEFELKTACGFLSPHPTSAIAIASEIIRRDSFIGDMLGTSHYSGVRDIWHKKLDSLFRQFGAD